MGKAGQGRFFEDFRLGETVKHAVPRTISGGERALYHALYPSRFAIHSSDEFARACGLSASPFDELGCFHVVFGRSVPDISLNAVANLGYAECRFLRPVFPGDTLKSTSEVIGLKQNSSGKTGIVWVRTRGVNQHEKTVIEFVRWVMVRKRNRESPPPDASVPALAAVVSPSELPVPDGLNFRDYDFVLAGEPYRLGDYVPGETIDHVDRITIEEADHMAATRLWQNTARVHFDSTLRDDGRRLIYGGHVISLARSLSFNGLANAQFIAAVNAGSHVHPCFAGDTVRAWSHVLDIAPTPAPGVGALRLRLVAATADTEGTDLRDESGRYRSGILLDLDCGHWFPPDR